MQEQDSLQPSHETEAADDGRIVAGVLAKDRKATAEFVARCADWIYPFVRRRLVPRAELVEDLMQEILVSAWQALPNFRGDGNLRSWVMGISRHKLEDYYRKKIRELEIPVDDDFLTEAATTPTFEQQMDSFARQERVQSTLARLPEAYALVLMWQYRDEKSIREIANLTGKTEKAIERLLARARESFRRRWNDGEI